MIPERGINRFRRRGFAIGTSVNILLLAARFSVEAGGRGKSTLHDEQTTAERNEPRRKRRARTHRARKRRAKV